MLIRSRQAPGALSDALRGARTRRGLAQTEVARHAGIAQRQVSDLERGVIDARLSTLQNVARHLDLELMLVPRALVTTVEGLIRAADSGSADTPVYALGDSNDIRETPERP
jgi:transcriptional regulator with XRE-family HTH domain